MYDPVGQLKTFGEDTETKILMSSRVGHIRPNQF
jgi:hypothetical protein